MNIPLKYIDCMYVLVRKLWFIALLYEEVWNPIDKSEIQYLKFFVVLLY